MNIHLWERVPDVGAEIRKAREPSARLWRGTVRRNSWVEKGCSCGEDLQVSGLEDEQVGSTHLHVNMSFMIHRVSVVLCKNVTLTCLQNVHVNVYNRFI